MIYRVAVLGALLLAGASVLSPAQTEIYDIQIVKGSCDESSHTSEGPLGADLTKRHSRFFCDSAVITFFDNHNSHVMIQFSEKKAHHAPILGFAGQVENDGIMMPVDHVYLEPGKATPASDGVCKFFFEDRHMKSIVCGMKADEGGRRTVAVVVFNAAPGQTSEFKIGPDDSKSNTPPSKPQMGVDDLAGGKPEDIWQMVESDGREIYVMTNGRYFSTERYSGKIGDGEDTLTKRLVYGFATYIVANLPESAIVGAPLSVMNNVEGNCETRHYHVLGSLFFAGKNRSGTAMQNMPPEDVERTLVPNSPFEKAFDMLCKIAKEQK